METAELIQRACSHSETDQDALFEVAQRHGYIMGDHANQFRSQLSCAQVESLEKGLRQLSPATVMEETTDVSWCPCEWEMDSGDISLARAPTSILDAGINLQPSGFAPAPAPAAAAAAATSGWQGRLTTNAIEKRGEEADLYCKLWQALAAGELSLPEGWAAAHIHPSWNEAEDLCVESDGYIKCRKRHRLAKGSQLENLAPKVEKCYAHYMIQAAREIMLKGPEKEAGSTEAYRERDSYWQKALAAPKPWKTRVAKKMKGTWDRSDNAQSKTELWARFQPHDQHAGMPKLTSGLVELVKRKQAQFTFRQPPPPQPARPPPAELAGACAAPMKLELGAAAAGGIIPTHQKNPCIPGAMALAEPGCAATATGVLALPVAATAHPAQGGDDQAFSTCEESRGCKRVRGDSDEDEVRTSQSQCTFLCMPSGHAAQ